MPETIGQRLKRAREYRNLTLEKVEEAIHIRVQFLKALEEDDFSSMPSPVHARGFLRNYAEYLKLDLEQMVEDLRTEPVEPDAEAEIIFEGELVEPLKEEQSEAEEESSAEPFWQTWLRRNRQEAGMSDEISASQLEPEPISSPQGTSDLKPESTPEKDTVSAGETSPREDVEAKPSLWQTLLNSVNIRVLRKQPELPGKTEEIEEEPSPEPESDPEPSTIQGSSSQEIVKQIGAQLRQRREMISLSLEEIERHTRMRAQFLDALEKGNLDELPSPVQTRGMLANYATFLDMDVDALLFQFAEALQARHRERHPGSPARQREHVNIPSSVPTLRSFIAGDMVFGIGVVLMLVIFSIWGITRVIALQSEQEAEVQAEATGPSISEALIGTPAEVVDAEVTLIPAEDTPIPDLPEGTVEIPTQALNVNVQVNVVAVERTFLRVIVDDEVAFDGRTIPGNAYPFEAAQSIELLAGNGAAIRVVYNQRDLGLLGGFGQIARYVYTADEILVPTPEIPPTPTNTLFVSPTPSETPSPTLTPVASPTDAIGGETE
jgi:cytoskeletal protein RodZ